MLVKRSAFAEAAFVAVDAKIAAQAVVSSAAAQQVVAGEAEHQIVPAAAFQGLRRRRAENGVVAGLGDLLAIERVGADVVPLHLRAIDRKSTRLNSSH